MGLLAVIAFLLALGAALDFTQLDKTKRAIIRALIRFVRINDTDGQHRASSRFVALSRPRPFSGRALLITVAYWCLCSLVAIAVVIFSWPNTWLYTLTDKPGSFGVTCVAIMVMVFVICMVGAWISRGKSEIVLRAAASAGPSSSVLLMFVDLLANFFLFVCVFALGLSLSLALVAVTTAPISEDANFVPKVITDYTRTHGVGRQLAHVRGKSYPYSDALNLLMSLSEKPSPVQLARFASVAREIDLGQSLKQAVRYQAYNLCIHDPVSPFFYDSLYKGTQEALSAALYERGLPDDTDADDFHQTLDSLLHEHQCSTVVVLERRLDLQRLFGYTSAIRVYVISASIVFMDCSFSLATGYMMPADPFALFDEVLEGAVDVRSTRYPSADTGLFETSSYRTNNSVLVPVGFMLVVSLSWTSVPWLRLLLGNFGRLNFKMKRGISYLIPKLKTRKATFTIAALTLSFILLVGYLGIEIMSVVWASFFGG